MRKEFARVAGRAFAQDSNLVFGNSYGQQLPPVGLGKIQMKLWAVVAVAGSASVHEQHRIFLPDGIRFKHLMEQVAGIGKLGFKFALHLIAHFVAASSDAWTDHGLNVLGR